MKALSAFFACALIGLAGCGGGETGEEGGGGGGPIIDPPIGDGTDWSRTSEYNDNYALALINALPLYNLDQGGNGAIIAVIDTGIDTDNPEFAGKIHTASRSFTDVDITNIEDIDGHGTPVAAVAAGSFGSGYTHGVAFDAELLILDAYNDNSGSYSDPVLIEAITYAVDNGADVINLSLGGDGVNPAFNDALQYATDRGVIVVVSTGNGDGASIDDPAYEAGDVRYSGLVLAVASVGESNSDPNGYVISGFSSRCDSIDPRYCLSAPGDNVPATSISERTFLYDGTSFSAPVVSGALAVLLQAFPELTPEQAVQIILETADDRDTNLTSFDDFDTVYGNGLIDLEAAMGPAGTVTTTSGVAINSARLQSSAAFGDALSSAKALSRVLIQDAYSREFEADFRNLVEQASHVVNFSSITEFDSLSTNSFGLNDFATITYSYAPSAFDEEFSEADHEFGLRLDYQVSDQTQISISGGTMEHDSSVFSFASNNAPIFNLSAATLSPYSQLTQGGTSFGISQKLGEWHLDFGISGGADIPQDSTAFKVKAERTLTENWQIGLSSELIYEKGAILGLQGFGGFDGGFETQTLAMGLGAGYTNGPLGLFGQIHLGKTSVKSTRASLLDEFSRIDTSAASFGASYDNIFARSDRLTLTATQSLRIDEGQVNLQSEAIDDSVVNLSPSGQERSIELNYQRRTRNGALLGFALALIDEPAHNAMSSQILAAGIRYQLRF